MAGSRDEDAPPLSRARGSRGFMAPPRRPVCSEVGSGVCPGSGCLQLTAACKVAAAAEAAAAAAAATAAGPEQDGAAAGNRSGRRRGRGSWPGGRRGRQVSVKSWAGTCPAAASEGCWRLWRFSPAPTPFALELAYGRRVLRAPKPKGAPEGSLAPHFCLPGSGHLLWGQAGSERAPQCGEERRRRWVSARGGGTGLGKGGPPASPLALAGSEATRDFPFPGFDQMLL